MSFEHYINSAKSNLDAGNMPGAEMLLQKAKAELEKLGYKHIAWLAYYVNLSAVYNNTGRFAECIDACEKAKSVAPFRGENHLKGQIAAAEATAWLNTCNYDNALLHGGRATSLFQQAGARKEEGMAMLQQGIVLFRTGKWTDAIENFSKAIQVSKEYGDVKLEVKALIEIGTVFRQERLLYLAIDHFREAEWKSKANGYVLNQASALFERAATYLALDRQKDAQICMQEIEKITPEDSAMRSFLLRLRYKIALRQGNYLSALDYAHQFREFFEKAGDQNGIAESLVLIGNAHFHLGHLEDAKENATTAFKKAKQTRDIEMIAASSALLTHLSNTTVDNAIGVNEDVTENELTQEQKPPTILDILDDIAREEEDVRSEPILGFVWSDFGGEEKFKICEERPGGPYVLRPTAPVPISYYRGQVAFHEPCVPTLYRPKDNGEKKDDVDIFIERLRAIEFELLLQGHPFVKEVYDKGVNVTCMGEQKTVPLKVSYPGLAQHYGLQTDMIDFTSDKWVAAFLATYHE
jgi:tetratricopeptide (TPR) repeat protein